MVTPDFEDWLRRQDIPVEDTVTLDRYTGYLEKELGIHGGSLDVAGGVYTEKYDILPQVGIHPFDWKGTIRYGITGMAGAWGRESALRIGEERAESKMMYEAAELFRRWHEEEFGEE
jgi:hypothetical protein